MLLCLLVGRYDWLNAKIENREQFERDVEKVCQVYLSAAINATLGIRTISVDEKTGIQALERAAPTKPMEPGKVERMGKVERIEYNYERHGTKNLFGNLNVATGEIIAPKLHATRTAENFADNIDALVATAPEAQWIFVCDNLNTHYSVVLVMLVAILCDIPLDTLGKIGKRGVLKSQTTRKAFLEDTSHRMICEKTYLPSCMSENPLKKAKTKLKSMQVKF